MKGLTEDEKRMIDYMRSMSCVEPNYIAAESWYKYKVPARLARAKNKKGQRAAPAVRLAAYWSEKTPH